MSSDRVESVPRWALAVVAGKPEHEEDSYLYDVIDFTVYSHDDDADPLHLDAEILAAYALAKVKECEALREVVEEMHDWAQWRYHMDAPKEHRTLDTSTFVSRNESLHRARALLGDDQ